MECLLSIVENGMSFEAYWKMECHLKYTGNYNVFQGILEMSFKTYQTTEIKSTS
jgi:hypothetical protein